MSVSGKKVGDHEVKNGAGATHDGDEAQFLKSFDVVGGFHGLEMVESGEWRS